MRKLIIFLTLIILTNFVNAQTYTQKFNVQHGDTIFLKTTVTTYTIDSVERYVYSYHNVLDSTVTQDTVIYLIVPVADTAAYWYHFKVITGVVADSIQLNKYPHKTINNDSVLGSGNITVSGSGGISQTTLNDTSNAIRTTVNGKSPITHNHLYADITDPPTIPTNTNQLTNGAGFLVAADITGKANLASPTFTGTVSGITATMVGLGNVNNTSDASKPVSTAQQTALDLKQNTISLTTTGTSGAATFNGTTLNIPNYATGGGMTRVFLPSDVINNNAVANTIADVTALSFAVTANTTYQFRFVIVYSSAATTTGSRWSINGPAATHMSYTSQYPTTATAITNNAALAGYNLPAASNASSLTTNNRCIIEGEIRPSADGTVIARFASEISASAITAIASGRSYVEYQIIN